MSTNTETAMSIAVGKIENGRSAPAIHKFDGFWRGVPWDVVAILIFGFVAEFLVNPIVNFPSSDDWVYALAVKEILRSGIYGAPSPSLPDLVLQAYWGALFCLPFGFSFVALRMSTLVLASIGLVATYGFCREIGASRGIARVVVLTLALDPLFFHLANSFMTDVPHVALMSISLWAFSRGMRQGKSGWIGLAIGVALAAILVRQFAIVLVLALCVAWVAERRWSRRSLIVLALSVFFGAAEHFLFQYWLVYSGRTPHNIIQITRDIIPLPSSGLLPLVVGHGFIFLQYLGLMLSPLYLATGFSNTRKILKKRPAITMALIAFIIFEGTVISVNSHASLPDYGNVLQNYGIGPLSLRDSVLSIHQPNLPFFLKICWSVARGVGIVVATAIAIDFIALGWRFFATFLGRQMAWQTVLPLVLIAGYGSGIMLMATVHGAFDRYLLSLILPLVMVAICHSGAAIQGWRWASAAALVLAAFGFFSITAVHDYLAFQRARLAATDELEAAGVLPSDIEGGYEYDGFKLGRTEYQQSPGASDWWKKEYLYVISSGPMPGYVVDRRYEYSRWLTQETDMVMALKRLK